MLRLLQVITDTDRRGAQVFALDLAVGLQALGVHATTVALAPGTRREPLEVTVLGKQPRAMSTLRALRRAAKEHDVVIAHGSKTLIACAIALTSTRIPFVYRQVSDPLFWAATWSRRLRTAAFLRRARGIVALSSDTATTMGSHYWLPASGISVIPNAVPGDRFRPPRLAERDEARRDFDLGIDATVALYVGALVAEKGVDLAIRAVAASDSAILVVVGDGPEREEVERLGRELLGDRARFLGPLPDVRPLYWASDVMVFPTRGGDSMPAALIEASLCGVPAVTCPVGAIPDMVDDGKSGFVRAVGDVAEISDGVVRLVDDPRLRAAFGAEAESISRQRFTIDRVAPDYLREIERATRKT